MRKILIGILLVVGLNAHAQVYESRGDIQYPQMGLTDLQFMQAAKVSLGGVLLQDGSAYTNIADKSAVFLYATNATPEEGFVIVTNTSVATATGSFLFDIPQNQTDTNGIFWYSIKYLDGSGDPFFTGTGTLEIVETTAAGSTAGLDLSVPIDWSAASYNNAGDGPTIGDGTTITAVTNVGGQLVLSAVGGGAQTPWTSDIDADDNSLTNLSSLQLSGGTGTQGTFSWNADEETADLICDGAVLQLGQELYWHVRNNSGAIISNGVVCGATGTIGASGRMTVGKYLADGGTSAMLIIGVATEDIADGTDGKVSAFGKVRGIDTSMYDEGAVLYPSSTVAGGFTTNAPSSPAIASPIAFVLTKHAVNGTIAVRVHPADDNEFATFAQGALADSALQNGDNISASNLTVTGNQTNSGDIVVGGDGSFGGSVAVGTNLVYGVGTGVTFSDGDTGIRESADDTMELFLGGGGRSIYNNSTDFYTSLAFNMSKYNYGSSYPTYSFRRDTNSGYDQAYDDVLAMSAGGVYRFYVGTTAVTSTVPMTIIESATNSVTKQWYSASNRWAEVYIKGSVTNVVFTSPVM